MRCPFPVSEGGRAADKEGWTCYGRPLTGDRVPPFTPATGYTQPDAKGTRSHLSHRPPAVTALQETSDAIRPPQFRNALRPAALASAPQLSGTKRRTSLKSRRIDQCKHRGANVCGESRPCLDQAPQSGERGPVGRFLRRKCRGSKNPEWGPHTVGLNPSAVNHPPVISPAAPRPGRSRARHV